MNRDVSIAAGLVAVPVAVLAAGVAFRRFELVLAGLGIGALILPVSYKLVRYKTERESRPGAIVADIRRSANGPLSRGMLVSLSGIDGSGKSTIGERTVEALEARGVSAVKVWGRWEPRLSYPLMGILYILWGWRRKDYRRSSLLRRFWGYAVLIDQVWFAVTRLYPRLVLGRVVVVDRYLLDQYVEFRYDELENPRAWKLFEQLLPTPSVEFYLDVPVEVALERKTDTQAMLDRLRADTDAETYLKDRRALFESVVAEGEVIRLKTTRSLDEVVDDVVERVLDAYYDV